MFIFASEAMRATGETRGFDGTQSALERRNAHGAVPTRFDPRIHHLPLRRFTWMWILVDDRTLPVTACRTLRRSSRRWLVVVHHQRRWRNRHCTHSDKSRVLVEHSSIAPVGEAESVRHSAGSCRDHIYRRGEPLDVAAFVGGRRQRSARVDFAGGGDLHVEPVAGEDLDWRDWRRRTGGPDNGRFLLVGIAGSSLVDRSHSGTRAGHR
jgi:hypothetical protein